MFRYMEVNTNLAKEVKNNWLWGLGNMRGKIRACMALVEIFKITKIKPKTKPWCSKNDQTGEYHLK